MENSEQWRPVVGYEGLYEISDHGKVRSLYREGKYMARWGLANMRFPAKDLSISKTRNGYCYVSLSKDGRQRKDLIHRIVMRAFVGESGLQVNHKDGIKENNDLRNLEYCTPGENLRHCIEILGKKRGTGSGSAKFTESDIPKIRADTRTLKAIAADYGVTLQAIHLVKSRKNWGHIP